MSTNPTSDVNDALYATSPGLEGAAINPTADLQADLGLDSMDSINLVAAIRERTGIEIPDHELAHLRTVAQIVAYLRDHGAPS
ncbi:unannotated protein [freshwater metagenome]|uniref:Unannotated protein n=1 Tax=freshwater metagenome TaxID=449393 RepID=A0A6J7ECI5_9ZZZZ|nr:acyl carrier protein [Actinomycetota bacterium]